MKLEEKKCSELNQKMMKYSKIRYPGQELTEEEAKEILKFTNKFIEEIKELKTIKAKNDPTANASMLVAIEKINKDFMSWHLAMFSSTSHMPS